VSVVLPLPEDVDVSGMDYMPLYIGRLTRSRAWLRAKHWTRAGPGLGFAMFNLWMRAFEEQPAGSIDADDDVLMDAAQVSPHDWPHMRDAALKGWELIDGRYYHGVVLEVVWKLWQDRIDARYDAAKDRWKRAANRAREKGDDPPEHIGTREEWIARTYPATSARLFPAVGANGDCPGGGDAMSPGQNGIVTGTEAERTGDMRGTDCDGPEDVPRTNAVRPSGVALKVSEGKVEDIPPYPPVDEARKGHEREKGRAGAEILRLPQGQKQWFEGELARLRGAFGDSANALISMSGGARKFVEIFKGAEFVEAMPGRLARIVLGSQARARQLRTYVDLLGIEAACFPHGLEVIVQRRRA
jgi:hypothetical protein